MCVFYALFLSIKNVVYTIFPARERGKRNSVMIFSPLSSKTPHLPLHFNDRIARDWWVCNTRVSWKLKRREKEKRQRLTLRGWISPYLRRVDCVRRALEPCPIVRDRSQLNKRNLEINRLLQEFKQGNNPGANCAQSAIRPLFLPCFIFFPIIIIKP